MSAPDIEARLDEQLSAGLISQEDADRLRRLHRSEPVSAPRPVKAGDVLVRSGFRSKPLLEGTLFYAETLAKLGWTHADGTPIAPPEPVAVTPAVDEPGCRCGLYVGACPQHDPRYREAAIAELRADREKARYPLPPPALPTAKALARALFATDPEVVRFVEHVGDAWRADANVWSGPSNPRTIRALAIAWDRDELGARTRAEHRAEAVLAALGGGR